MIQEHLVIVFALEHYNPLGLIRSLGENGINPIYFSIKRRQEIATYSKYISNTDDGSYGESGFVTTGLETLVEKGNKYDICFVVGPIIMMKNVSLLTKKYNIKTVVSMNPLMIDGTGMCGCCCRLMVDGKMKFACIDGPDFDGHKVDYDEMISRNLMYKEEEKKARDESCNLFKGASNGK